MKYSLTEVIQYIMEEDVKFVRLAFCDIFGRQKNISVMPSEIDRAFRYGIAIDASAIMGFDMHVHSDLLLHPDPDTLAVLPWRPEHGRVVRMYCSLTYPDGRPFECDTRGILMRAVEEAKSKGYSFSFGPELKFYLFKRDENGDATKIPYDHAGYMDIAPDDKGENVRREICLSLEQMGIQPECSHHEEGPGQNEITIRHADALTAADNATTLMTVIKTIAYRNGLCADFSPKPIDYLPGNGFHINLSVNDNEMTSAMIAGILEKIGDMTLFLNPSEDSYLRLNSSKAPKYITWSEDDRSAIIRIPTAYGESKRIELRSPDPCANPYLAFALVIYAAMYGIENGCEPANPVNRSFFENKDIDPAEYREMPLSKMNAVKAAANSAFIAEHLPAELIREYCR